MTGKRNAPARAGASSFKAFVIPAPREPGASCRATKFDSYSVGVVAPLDSSRLADCPCRREASPFRFRRGASFREGYIHREASPFRFPRGALLREEYIHQEASPLRFRLEALLREGYMCCLIHQEAYVLKRNPRL